MISKNSFLADLAANNKRRTWNIAIFVVLLLIFYPLFLALVLRSVFYNGLESRELIVQMMNQQFRQYMCFPVWDIIIATIFASIASIHGFSYLYSKKKIDMYMALPVSKKRRFATIYINGLLMYFIPLAVCFVLCLLIGKSFGVNDGSIFKIMVMSFGVNCIYYFSIYNVVLIALMLTGNFVVTVLGAGTLLFYENGLRLLLLGYFQKFFNSFSHYSSDKFLKTWISPIGVISSIQSKVANVPDKLYTASYIFNQIKMSTVQLFALSIVFFIIAYLLYLKRPMESCAKAMAFVKTKNVIKRFIMVPAALFVGICFCIGSGERSDVPVMILGLVIGTLLCHCVVEMIYEFDIRAVFKDKRSIIYCGVVAGAIFAIFSLDVFGYDKYVPENNKIDHAAIFIAYNNAYSNSSFNDKFDYLDENDRVFEDMKVTKTDVITDLAHENMGKKRDDTNPEEVNTGNTNLNNSTNAEVCYTLKNGKKVYRAFNIDYSKNEELLNKLFANNEYKLAMSNVNSPVVNKLIGNMSLSYSNGVSHLNTGLDVKDFINTYKSDYNAMTFSDIYEKIPVGYIELKYDISKYESRALDYPVYKSYTNTIAKLQAAGIDVENYLIPEEIENISINNYNYIEDSDSEKRSNGIEKTYDDKNSVKKVSGALVPSEVSSSGYACGNLFYDSCDATVNLIGKKGSYNWSPVNCMLLREKTPDFVKTDLHIDENNAESETDGAKPTEEAKIIEEITGTTNNTK